MILATHINCGAATLLRHRLLAGRVASNCLRIWHDNARVGAGDQCGGRLRYVLFGRIQFSATRDGLSGSIRLHSDDNVGRICAPQLHHAVAFLAAVYVMVHVRQRSNVDCSMAWCGKYQWVEPQTLVSFSNCHTLCSACFTKAETAMLNRNAAIEDVDRLPCLRNGAEVLEQYDFSGDNLQRDIWSLVGLYVVFNGLALLCLWRRVRKLTSPLF